MPDPHNRRVSVWWRRSPGRQGSDSPGHWSAFLKLVVEPAGSKAILIPSHDTAELLNTEAGRKGSLVVDGTYDSLEAKV